MALHERGEVLEVDVVEVGRPVGTPSLHVAVLHVSREVGGPGNRGGAFRDGAVERGEGDRAPAAHRAAFRLQGRAVPFGKGLGVLRAVPFGERLGVLEGAEVAHRHLVVVGVLHGEVVVAEAEALGEAVLHLVGVVAVVGVPGVLAVAGDVDDDVAGEHLAGAGEAGAAEAVAFGVGDDAAGAGLGALRHREDACGVEFARGYRDVEEEVSYARHRAGRVEVGAHGHVGRGVERVGGVLPEGREVGGGGPLLDVHHVRARAAVEHVVLVVEPRAVVLHLHLQAHEAGRGEGGGDDEGRVARGGAAAVQRAVVAGERPLEVASGDGGVAVVLVHERHGERDRLAAANARNLKPAGRRVQRADMSIGCVCMVVAPFSGRGGLCRGRRRRA